MLIRYYLSSNASPGTLDSSRGLSSIASFQINGPLVVLGELRRLLCAGNFHSDSMVSGVIGEIVVVGPQEELSGNFCFEDHVPASFVRSSRRADLVNEATCSDILNGIRLPRSVSFEFCCAPFRAYDFPVMAPYDFDL